MAFNLNDLNNLGNNLGGHSNADGSYTEVTRTGWGSRMGNSFKGIWTGILLIVAATCLLWWNEGRTVRTGGAIAEAQIVAVELPSNESVDSSFEGKLVHSQGVAKSNEELSDSLFGIKVKGLKLERKVQFYQWVESSHTRTEKKVGGAEEKITTYTYDRKWVNSPTNSGSFKNPMGHENRILLDVKREVWQSQNVSFGAYKLPDFLVSSISNSQKLTPQLSQEELRNLANNLGLSSGGLGQSFSNSLTSGGYVHLSGNQIYLGMNPASPNIGDVRVEFAYTPDTDISIIAKVSGDTFTKYKAANGENFSQLSTGKKEMSEMFEDAKKANSMMAWGLRALGVILAISGFKMILAPLVVLADVVPMIGNLVGAGTGFIAGILGVSWSFIIIAIAWLRFRPILSGILLAVAAVLIILAFVRKGKKKEENLGEQLTLK